MGKTELTGAYMAQMAEDWRKANPEAWERMKAWATEYIAEGRRFSMERLIQRARYETRVDVTSHGFKVNNSTRAALARQLISEIPESRKYIEIRNSKVDDRSAA